jgi:hypothetical protein
VADARLYFPFSVRISDPARQRHHAIVSEHIAKQWIDGGIVDVGKQHTFFQVGEDHDSWTAPEATKGFLMEFGPDAPTGAPSAERQVSPHAAVRADARLQPQIGAFAGVAFHRPTAVIDLRFFPW